MTRIATQIVETATGSNKDTFAALQKGLGMVPNMTKVMGNSPAVLHSYIAFSGALNASKLSAPIREQIAVMTAEHNECDYCLSAHSALGKLAGLKQNQIDAAREGESDDERTQAALIFARAVLRTTGGVSDADFAAARGAGFSDGELAEIVAAVALNVFTNLFNRAFQVDVDFPLVKAHSHGAAR